MHDKLKAESWRIDQLDEQPRRTWDEAAEKWLAEKGNHKRRHALELEIRALKQFLGGKILNDITRDDIVNIGESKLSHAKPATANRQLQLVRAILRKACDVWEWIDKVPKVTLYEEANARVRWLTTQQAQTLLAELPEHQRAMALFALATGLRQSNVSRLRWAQVDLERRQVWIPADEAKGGEDLYVPLNDLAIDIIRRQFGKHPERIFTYKGTPIVTVNTRCWRNALKRAGISDFRWHDLRHTWASWLIQNGTPLYDLQEMGGWKTESMVKRYAHLAQENLAKHAAVIDVLLHDTTASQGLGGVSETAAYSGVTH